VKILHVVQGYPPAVGGTEHLFWRLSETLAAQFGDEVTVFTTNCTGGDAFADPSLPRLAAGETTIKGVRVVRFPVRARLSRALKLPQYLAYHLRLPFNQYLRTWYQGPIIPGLTAAIRQSDADLVVASSFPLLHMYTSLKAGHQSGKPVILCPGLHPEDPWSFEREMISRSLAKADGIITYTGYETRWITDEGIDPQKITAIGLGVDPAPFQTASGHALRKAWGWPEDAPAVGFIGQVVAHKGVDLLLLAMPRVWEVLPEARLLIAGARRPFADRVDDIIQSWPHEWQKRIRRVYDFAEADKAALYAALDVFVYPSQFESFGIAFLEAWSARKPVIGCRRGAIPWVVHHNEDGLLVDCADPESLTRAIVDLLKNPSEAARLAENGQARTLSSHTWPEVARRFREVYARVLARKESV
jgi:glycosyltransferase involved in cell wall biosynthesis